MHLPIEEIIAILFCMVVVSAWLLNRLTYGSLSTIIHREVLFRSERDMLLAKIQRQDDELQSLHFEKLTQLYRFAEFGKLSAGIFHDLINPLNAISLNISELDPQNVNIAETQKYVDRAVRASKETQEIITALQNQLSFHDTNTSFNPAKELEQVLLLLQHKAKRAETRIQTNIRSISDIFGNPIRFQQILGNLISMLLMRMQIYHIYRK